MCEHLVLLSVIQNAKDTLSRRVCGIKLLIVVINTIMKSKIISKIGSKLTSIILSTSVSNRVDIREQKECLKGQIIIMCLCYELMYRKVVACLMIKLLLRILPKC